MLDSLNWITMGLGVAFAVAGVSYYAWVFGIGTKLAGMHRIRLNTTMARLRGRLSEREPADDVQQALHDALNGTPVLGSDPADDLWIPEVRTPPAHRQRDAS